MAKFKWRLYYEDGTTFSSTEGKPQDSPPWGVVGVSQPGKEYESLLIGTGDFYIYRKDLKAWHELGDTGLMDHLAFHAHLIDCVRPGRWMAKRGDFKEVVKTMREDAEV